MGTKTSVFFPKLWGILNKNLISFLPQLLKSTTSIGVSTHMAPTVEDDDAKRARLRRKDEP